MDDRYSCWHCVHHQISRCDIARESWPRGNNACPGFSLRTDPRGPLILKPVAEQQAARCVAPRTEQ